MTDSKQSKARRPAETSKKPSIGIALGGGAARGWAHIGVLQQLAEMGIHPDIVCGCSAGSLVGAAYAANNLSKLEQWVLSLTRLEMLRYFEFNRTLNGFVKQEKLRQFFHEQVCAQQQSIEGLDKQFASVATNLHNGREIWFTKGPVIDAVWASIALPGLFPPVLFQDQWLVDGGLVNPVPVSLCRVLGADIVIAVNLNGGLSVKKRAKKVKPKVGQESVIPEQPPIDSRPLTFDSSLVGTVTASLREYSSTLFPLNKSENPVPRVMDTLAGSIYIMQDRITRSRMVGDPPEILLNPRLNNVGLLEFYRASEGIKEGRQCVLRMQPEVEHVISSM